MCGVQWFPLLAEHTGHSARMHLQFIDLLVETPIYQPHRESVEHTILVKPEHSYLFITVFVIQIQIEIQAYTLLKPGRSVCYRSDMIRKIQ